MKSLLVISMLLLSCGSVAFDRILPEDELQTLEVGSIGITRHVLGGLLSVYPGFGIGQAVQGRYSQTGWIFTLGESVSAIAVIYGLGECGVTAPLSSHGSCSGSGLILTGAMTFIGFRIWEIFDGWYGPFRQNKNFEKIREKNTSHLEFSPLVVLTGNDTGLLGVRLSF